MFPIGALASRTPSWCSAYAVLGGCLLVAALIHHATLAEMVESWSRDPLAHGYFVIPVTVYMAWTRRRRLQESTTRPVFWTVVLLALFSFAWLLGNLTFTALLEQAALVSLFIVLTWGILGTSAALALMFPLSILLFAVPVGERVAPLLQELTARLAVRLLEATHVPALLVGPVISVPGTRWLVSEACGGINYVTASVLVGYVYAGAVYRQWRHRLAFVVASAAVPVAGNVLRVYTTILLDYHGATRVASGMGHYLYGFAVFTTMMIILFVTCGRWHEQPRGTNADRPERSRPDDAVSGGVGWRTAVYAVMSLLVIASGPAAATALWAAPGSAEPAHQSAAVVSLPWTQVDEPPIASPKRLATVRSEFLRTYRSEGRVVFVHIASYGSDLVTGDLVTRNALQFDGTWWPAAEGYRPVVWRGQSLRVRETEVRLGERAVLAWSWYNIDDHSTAVDYVGKLLLARARLLQRPRGGDRILVFTPGGPGVDAAAILQDFLAHFAPASP